MMYWIRIGIGIEIEIGIEIGIGNDVLDSHWDWD